MTKVRLDWTLADFYADGGTTRFVDRMAASLGIPAYRIKTIAVYEGSVIIEFSIEAEEVDENDDDAVSTTKQLSDLKQKLISGIEDDLFDFGAPIMGL